MHKVVFIVGATGTGKSDLAVDLAKLFGGEVISCDSVQVFKGFDIGSAKITKQQMQGVRHHLLDLCEPNDYFSVSDFVQNAETAIEEITKRGHLPIVVGGTGLYVNALINGFNFGQTDRHQDFREEIAKKIEELGFDSVLKELEKLDSKLAQKVNLNNKKRLIRAYEIAEFGDKQISNKPQYDFLLFALTMPREQLYQRLDLRAQKIVDDGLVEEVKQLIQKGARPDCQPMRAIGYKEVLPYLQGEISHEEMIALLAQHTRNYAKRQMTYLRSMQKTNQITYVDITQENVKTKIAKKIKEWLC